MPREPEMVALPGGTFRMGSGADPSEQPVHPVTVKPFLLGRYPVTVREWRDCVAAHGCDAIGPGITGPAADTAPMSNLSWTDAHRYTAWLSATTGKEYRLPTEAEWEYAARAGAETPYWWGARMSANVADCKGCGGPYDPRRPLEVTSLKPNPFGLFGMAGGVAQWVEDCWHRDYRGAPRDGSAWPMENCREHVLRGGSWRNDPTDVRVAARVFYDTTVRYPAHGMRVARSQ
jgi:formylglycine-generating enzyme required for sulfatase activity